MNKIKAIDKDFHILIKDYQFAPAYPLWSKSITSLCRSIENSDCYCYILVTASKDDSLAVDMWIGPINYPDSSLDSNCTAFKIPIGITYGEDQHFLQKCQQRIINLIPSAYSLKKSVHQELLSPSLVATSQTNEQRMEAYNHYLQAYTQLKKHPSFPSIGRKIINIYTKKTRSLMTVSTEIKEIAPDILKNVSPASSAFLRNYLIPPFDLPSILAEFSFIEFSTQYAAIQ
ncbi:Imm25 family immunity protein [Pseudomonas endophytica]|uniref:Imm25 family immunity protein n=1 Tax=Pseudomonas endophytica TaxID=1563157 RepID=UPI000B2DEAE2|nr:Imm25 family immunity protein [Pseudomonas endophytica]